MRQIVTDLEILEALEFKRDDQSLKDVALELGFTSGSGLSRRMKRLRKYIPDYVRDMVKSYAINQVKVLVKNSNKGDTRAAIAILEMAGLYPSKANRRTNTNLQDKFGVYDPS